jgi:hypothetical protein
MRSVAVVVNDTELLQNLFLHTGMFCSVVAGYPNGILIPSGSCIVSIVDAICPRATHHRAMKQTCSRRAMHASFNAEISGISVRVLRVGIDGISHQTSCATRADIIESLAIDTGLSLGGERINFLTAIR